MHRTSNQRGNNFHKKMNGHSVQINAKPGKCFQTQNRNLSSQK